MDDDIRRINRDDLYDGIVFAFVMFLLVVLTGLVVFMLAGRNECEERFERGLDSDRHEIRLMTNNGFAERRKSDGEEF